MFERQKYKEEKVLCTGTNIDAMELYLSAGREAARLGVHQIMGKLRDRRMQTRRMRSSIMAEIVTVAFFCNLGKHRCVALATMFAEAWALLGGSVNVEHLCKGCWAKKGCGWSDCGACDPRLHSERRKALAKTVADWIEESM